jgi:AAA+ ATPase superfamily predicted ATPase
VHLPFANRSAELRELTAARRRGGLLVIFGRRRVGKTRLLRHWLRDDAGSYSQAIEAPLEMQLQQVVADIASLDTVIAPRTWGELLELVGRRRPPWTLCLDEFPYLVATDASLPSRLQRWIDHDLPRKCLLVLSGSSTRMMHTQFLDRAAPLYGRASKLIHLAPMDYAAFCAACDLDPAAMDSFEQFACTGGVPKYWESVERDRDALALADALYFGFSPFMEFEPQRLLRDEQVGGATAVALLEAIGRGAHRPSEIAGRLGVPQTNLTRLQQQLIDASIIVREVPWGQSVRTTKRALYRLADPALRFWFGVYSPHRTRWATYSEDERRKLIHEHAATVFEDHCRAQFPGAQRWWHGDIELDLVGPDPEDARGVVVAEVKWRKLSAAERRRVLQELEKKWQRSGLATDHPRARLLVLDATSLR